VVLSEDETLGAGAVQEVLGDEPTVPDASDINLRTARDRFEAAYIRQALRAHDGAIQVTADALGIDRSSLWRKMEAYDIGASD